MAQSFFTATGAAELVPNDVSQHLNIGVNDRAATREAVILKLQALGHYFGERSSWSALDAKSDMSNDRDYSMIALHHGGQASVAAREAIRCETSRDPTSAKVTPISAITTA